MCKRESVYLTDDILTVGFTSSCPMTVNMRERPTGVHTAEQRASFRVRRETAGPKLAKLRDYCREKTPV